MFKKYQHLERFGTTEVEQIELGECYIFPKIDGTNGSIWIEDGNIYAASRNRVLTLENDNHSFLAWVVKQSNIIEFLLKNPNIRLYGEWLVPHSLKTYNDNSWKKFYVFDVVIDSNGEDIKYLHYNDYKELLDKFNINYIPPITIIRNPDYNRLVEELSKNVYLIEDGKGTGEGIVIKNYSYKNKFGRQTWAKIVTNEFKEKHAKEMKGGVVEGKKLLEEVIANKYITKSFVDKEYHKILNETGQFTSKDIPKLLNICYYELIREESWNFIKENKNPNINYKTLLHFVFCKVRESKPELF